LKAYERLVKPGLGVLEKGGVLVSASCSSRVSADSFFETVIRAAAVAHPVGFPEGAYLKCIFAEA
jgi:23S rRNA (cytosine1962-C5)-methyltransferase